MFLFIYHIYFTYFYAFRYIPSLAALNVIILDTGSPAHRNTPPVNQDMWIALILSGIYTTDTAFVGMLHDTAAIGAVSVAFPIFLVVAALGQGLGVGSAS